MTHFCIAFDFKTLFIEELGWDNISYQGKRLRRCFAAQGPNPPLRSTALAPTILRRRCPSLFILVEIPTLNVSLYFCWLLSV